MKKLIGFAVILALLSFVACADASVGYRKDGEYQGAVADINIDGFAEADGRVLTIFSNGHRSGVTTNVSQESHLTSAALAYGVINRTALNNSVDYKVTIANGEPGQMVTIVFTGLTSGTYTITDDGVAGASGSVYKKTGWDDIQFNAALDSVTLLYVDDTVGWIIVGQNSVTIT